MNLQNVLLYIAVVGPVIVSIQGHNGVKIPGKYQLVTPLSDEAFSKFLEATGMHPEGRKKVTASKKVELVIVEPRGERWEVRRTTDGKIMRWGFESGKDFQTDLADGGYTTVMNTITIDQEAHTATRVYQTPACKVTQVATFQPDPKGGFILSCTCNEAKAELTFKRVGK